MALAPDIISRPGPLTIPYTYQMGATEYLQVAAAFATWNGTSASGPFLPCLSFYDPSGTLFMRVFPSTSISAGGTADVSYAPFPGGLTGANPSIGATVQLPVPLDTPDVNSGGYPAVTTNQGYANVSRVLPAFTKSVAGSWAGSIVVPQNYASGGTIVLSWTANATTGNIVWQVGSAVVANGASEDAAYTLETAQTVATPGTANRRKDTTFTLSTTPVAGSTLSVIVQRNGTSGSDTLAVDALLFAVSFQYTTT